jgi:hypothetical protein
VDSCGFLWIPTDSCHVSVLGGFFLRSILVFCDAAGVYWSRLVFTGRGWCLLVAAGRLLVAAGDELVAAGDVLVVAGVVLVAAGVVLVAAGVVLVAAGIILVAAGVVSCRGWCLCRG